jgi:chitinase
MCGMLGLFSLVVIWGANGHASLPQDSVHLQADPYAGKYQIIVHFLETIASPSPALSAYRVKDLVVRKAADKIAILNYSFAIPRPGPVANEIVAAIENPVPAYQQAYAAGESVDGVADDPRQPLRGHFNQLRKLKAAHPHLKVLVSIGGWTGSTWFSDAALTPGSRRAFVRSCIDLFIRGNLPVENGAGGSGIAAGIFDGFDIDWEYPVAGGDSGMRHNPGDSDHLTALLAEFRAEFKAMDRTDLLLTYAVPASEGTARNYHVNQDARYLDWIDLMTYDFHGAWDSRTGHLTNLCTSTEDPAPADQRLSVDRTIRLFSDVYRVDPRKLMLGGTMYGRGWNSVGNAGNGLYQAADGAAPGVEEAGANRYRNLVPLFAQDYVEYWDPRANAAWMFSRSAGTLWTYDNPRSLRLKAEYVRHHGLGGMLIWEISGDTDDGILIQAIHSTLRDMRLPGSGPCN